MAEVPGLILPVIRFVFLHPQDKASEANIAVVPFVKNTVICVKVLDKPNTRST